MGDFLGAIKAAGKIWEALKQVGKWIHRKVGLAKVAQATEKAKNDKDTSQIEDLFGPPGSQ